MPAPSHRTSSDFCPSQRLWHVGSRFGIRTSTLERFDDLGRGSLLDVGGPLHAIGIDPKCLDGFDVARAVVALVRTHLFEPIFAKQRSMSMDGRQQRGLVLHTHVGTGEGDHEVSPDASQLEHAPKLMGLADLALFDAGDRLSVKRQALAGFQRMGAHEVPHIQQVAPAAQLHLIQGAPNMPWQPLALALAQSFVELDHGPQLKFYQPVVVRKDRSTLFDGCPFREKEIAVRRRANALDVDVQFLRNVSVLLCLQKCQDVMGLLAELLHQDAIGGKPDIGLLDGEVHIRIEFSRLLIRLSAGTLGASGVMVLQSQTVKMAGRWKDFLLSRLPRVIPETSKLSQ